MGDGRKQALRTQFDSKLRLDFLGAKVTTDAGLFAFRDLDEGFRLYRLLEEEGLQYVIRIPANNVLMDRIGHLLIRPVGRPSYKSNVFYESFSYQAQSWDRPRRVVANVEWHWDELLPRVGFIVTNMTRWPKKVVKFYNGRGTAEQWIKEGKYAVKWTRLSCRDFRDNQARLQLFAQAYNLGNFLHRLALPRSVQHWSLTTLREKLTKIGAKVVRHSKYVTFQLAEVAVPRDLRNDPGAHPALRCAAAVGAAWLTQRTNVGCRFAGAKVDAARKRPGYVGVEASAAGLARWSSQIGMNHGERDRLRWNRVARLATMAA